MPPHRIAAASEPLSRPLRITCRNARSSVSARAVGRRDRRQARVRGGQRFHQVLQATAAVGRRCRGRFLQRLQDELRHPPGNGLRFSAGCYGRPSRAQASTSSKIPGELLAITLNVAKGVLVVVAGVHRKGHHQRFGRGAASCAAGRAFVMVLSCSNNSW